MGARLLLLVLAGTLDIKLGFFVGKSFFLSCVYVCVCSHNCVYVCIFMCMCTRVWKSGVNVGCLPQSPTTLFSETESLMELWVQQLGKASWRDAPEICLALISHPWTQAWASAPLFVCVLTAVLHAGPYAVMVNVLPNETCCMLVPFCFSVGQKIGYEYGWLHQQDLLISPPRFCSLICFDLCWVLGFKSKQWQGSGCHAVCFSACLHIAFRLLLM